MIRRGGRLLGLAALLGTSLALSGCTTKMSLFDPAGPVAEMQSSLLRLSMWFAIGIGLFVTVALLFVVFRFREKQGNRSVPKQIHGSTALEITWTLIPIVILAIVAVPTVQTAFATKETKDPNALQVRVVGHQWWFEFQYPELGITTANELVIPFGRDVALTLESADVIHSFNVPRLAGKMDIIPNRKNHMWMKADAVGEFQGQCAEFCGTSHANMLFKVFAVTPAEFDQYVAGLKDGAAEPTDPVAMAGRDLFMGKTVSKANCISCHTIDGTKAQAKVGPNLTNIGSRTTLASGIIENNEAMLKQWVRSPQSIKPGNKMAPHPNLTDEELNAIVTYLQGLK